MTAAMGIPISIRKPNPIDAPRRRAAVVAVASAALGANSTSTRPRRNEETVVAIHHRNRPITANWPALTSKRLDRRTRPSTVAELAITGRSRETTSPPTRARGPTVTRPFTATTSPSTLPVTATSPLNATTLPVTSPATLASPLKMTASLVTVPSGRSRRPVSTTNGSPLNGLVDASGPANAGAAIAVSPIAIMAIVSILRRLLIGPTSLSMLREGYPVARPRT